MRRTPNRRRKEEATKARIATLSRDIYLYATAQKVDPGVHIAAMASAMAYLCAAFSAAHRVELGVLLDRVCESIRGQAVATALDPDIQLALRKLYGEAD